MNPGQIVFHLTLATHADTPNTTGQQHSTEISSPITSLTPLQTIFRNPNSKLVFVGDLSPILPEEMPPSDLFFSKKWKAIIKREYHKKYGVIIKRKRMAYDRNDQDDP